MSGPIALGGPVLAYLTSALNARALGRRTPAKRNVADNLQALGQGFEKRVEDIGGGRKAPDIDLAQTTPNDNYNPWTAGFDPKVQSPLLFAGQGTDPVTGKEKVLINPNLDSAYLAHELGHVATKQTDIGSLTREARNYLDDPKNKKLATALALSTFGLGGAAAAINPGDDDLMTSVALASAPMVPTLVDEALATKNGLAIMENAGQRATLGQRGRLAGAYLSYVLPAIVGGGTANFLGNLVDENE